MKDPARQIADLVKDFEGGAEGGELRAHLQVLYEDLEDWLNRSQELEPGPGKERAAWESMVWAIEVLLEVAEELDRVFSGEAPQAELESQVQRAQAAVEAIQTSRDHYEDILEDSLSGR